MDKSSRITIKSIRRYFYNEIKDLFKSIQLKKHVSQYVFNPLNLFFLDDDDDFDINYLIDRNLQVRNIFNLNIKSTKKNENFEKYRDKSL